MSSHGATDMVRKLLHELRDLINDIFNPRQGCDGNG